MLKVNDSSYLNRGKSPAWLSKRLLKRRERKCVNQPLRVSEIQATHCAGNAGI